MPDPRETEVDAYIAGHLIKDEVITAALAANRAGGLPAIDVSIPQGKMLHLFARMAGARRILEIGTLGGVSTIFLARALPADGALVSLEIDPHHAEVARGNVASAGLAEKVDIRVGKAIESLDAMIAAGEGPFDLVFIDADKQSNAAYVRAAMTLGRPGTVIVVDNVVRNGRILEAESDDPMVIGTRALFELVGEEPRLSATAVQTVGSKHWDGFLLAMLDG
jgi:predicted O-methyltransferase YrrM